VASRQCNEIDAKEKPGKQISLTFEKNSGKKFNSTYAAAVSLDSKIGHFSRLTVGLPKTQKGG